LQQAPSRPTLLIGEGDFGADVLRRVLQHSALRGVLDRRLASADGGRANGDLALTLIDRGDPDATSVAEWGREAGSETLRDVYARIDVLRPAHDEVSALDRLVGIVKALISVSAATGHRDILPVWI
jgi:hypothetical protein